MIKLYSHTQILMGNRFVITVSCANDEEGQKYAGLAVAEISRIEKKLSTYINDSETNTINQAAGEVAVKVSAETFELIARAQKISKLTEGCFDLSYGSISNDLWNFNTKMTVLPDPITAKKNVRLINYKNIILDADNQTVFLKEKGMKIGFGGIGKGYAADMAASVLKANGVKSGVVNASGDMICWGTLPDASPWKSSIADPNHKNVAFTQIELHNKAIATSGDYEKYVMIEGKRYSHTIDPRTGLPITGIKSVSIVAPTAELADAFTTPVAIMGIERGLVLLNQIKELACIIIDDDNKLYKTENIHI